MYGYYEYYILWRKHLLNIFRLIILSNNAYKNRIRTQYYIQSVAMVILVYDGKNLKFLRKVIFHSHTFLNLN